MQDIKLFKKLSNYTDKDGNEKTATNLYLQCGDSLIPIEVKYFPDKDTKIDPNFRGRKMVISAFAEDLPGKPKTCNIQQNVETSEKGEKGESEANLNTPF